MGCKLHVLSISTKIGDLEWHNGCYFALFYRIRQLSGLVTYKWFNIDPYCLPQICSAENLAFSNI